MCEHKDLCAPNSESQLLLSEPLIILLFSFSCQLYTAQPEGKGSSIRSLLGQTGLWACLWGAQSLVLIDVRRPSPLDSATLRQVVLGYVSVH